MTILNRTVNLPLPLSSLVGRDEELRLLEEQLDGARLLTIAGTGGCGKSRLALALAERRCDSYSDGAFWVDLSGTTGREVPVSSVIRAALGVHQHGGDSASSLAEHLAYRETLLVLDNCEHVAAECASLLELLLRNAPALTALATSREPIGVAGERVVRIAGLALARPGEDAAGSEAVRLFVERARAVLPGFELAPEDLEGAAALCAGLDGLPLAIELAAARVGSVGLPELAERLQRGVRLLRHPSRTAPARQQSLAATLDWSHDLLRPGEQVLFRRLAAFRGTFSLLAAESVSAGEAAAAGRNSPVAAASGGVPAALGRAAALQRDDVLDGIAALVDKSLLQVADRGAEHRYRMLETVRQYAEERLSESGDEPAVRARHASFFLEMALRARAGLDGPDELRWLDRLELENDNVRAALEWTLFHDPEAACRLAAALWPFWYRRGHYSEGRYWLEEVLACSAQAPPDARAGVLAGAGSLAFYQCDYTIAEEHLASAGVLFEQSGDRLGRASVLQRRGSIAREQGRYADARQLHQQAREIHEGLGDEVGVAACDDYLGFAAWLAGDGDAALALCSQALSTFRRHGRLPQAASALVNLGAAAVVGGRHDEAVGWLQDALTIAEGAGYAEGVAWSLHVLAVAVAQRDLEASGAMLARSLRTHAELGDRWQVASVLESIAELQPRGVDDVLAARLLGVAGALREQLGCPLPPCRARQHGAVLARLARQLGPSELAEQLQQGRSLALAAAVELAASALGHGFEEGRRAPDAGAAVPRAERAPAEGTEGRAAGGRDGDQSGTVPGLTEREVEVLRLLARGLTNRQIGAELFISAGTAGVHVSNILRKLNVSGRVQAAGVAHRFGLDLG